ncbi:MAG: hypothetical protein QOE66_2850, partial [Chloroflexota bacterium]|nr:hypothetical protein [Chloroflexota bacterium]
GLGVPVAVADAYGTPAQTTLVVPASGVLANDIDLLGTNLTARLASNPTHGTLALASNGGFTYQPNGGFAGVDTFTYRAVDGLPSLNAATVSITVAPRLPTPTPTPTPSPTPTPTPPPTPTPTPRPTSAPTPTPTPTPSIPSLPIPTLPTPTLSIPTPIPTPSLPRVPGLSPIPSVAPPLASSAPASPGPTASAGPSIAPAAGVDASPPPGAGSSAGSPVAGGPIAGAGGTTSGGTDLVPTILGLGPISVGSLGDAGIGIEWIVPSVAVTLPGFLLIIFGLAQVFGGFMWLPVARRWLRGDGRRSAPRVTHLPT